MPAQTIAIPFAVGAVARINSGESREGLSHSRGRMAGQHPSGRVDDTNLIREAQKGNHRAFEELIRQYDQSVLRLALHLTGSPDDAQDIYQEAFLKAYKSVGNFRFECSFYTWLYRIVTNLCLDHLRRRKSRREDPATVIDSRGDEMDLLSNISDSRAMANPARELDRKRMGQCINDALAKL